MVKEGSSDYNTVRKRWLFKEPLTMVSLEKPFEAPLFLRVCGLYYRCYDLICLFSYYESKYLYYID